MAAMFEQYMGGQGYRGQGGQYEQDDDDEDYNEEDEENEEEEEYVETEEEEEQEPENPPMSKRRSQRAALVNDFLRLQPPTFYGTKPDEDPQHFVQDIARIGEMLMCPGNELVGLATFQLRGAARTWVETSPPMHTWEMFEEEFLNEFLSESVRTAKA